MADVTSEESIRVACRFRPINPKEQHDEKTHNYSSFDDDPVSISHETNTIFISKPKIKNNNNIKQNEPYRFRFDHVLDYNVTQTEAFTIIGMPIVEQVKKGYNCTMFAYGQTGSGKSYSMFGPENYGTRFDQIGIIPRSIDYLFSLLKKDGDIMKFNVRISIVEIYKEILKDLLTDGSSNNKKLEVYVSGKELLIKNVIEKQCQNTKDATQYIMQAMKNRHVTTTNFIGHDSSRSHCVVMLNIQQRLLDDTLKISKLNFGDLAGSEFAKKTGATGTTLTEAGKIHKGLLALENVISSLVDKKKHIPYRDSILTKILSDSLGGNSKTTLLVTASPHVSSINETLSTLRFAKRAKHIKNVAKINTKRTMKELEKRLIKLEAQNNVLIKKIAKLKKKNNENKGSMSLMMPSKGHLQQSSTMLLIKNEEDLKVAQNEINELNEQLQLSRERIENLEEELKERDELYDKVAKHMETINDLKLELGETGRELDIYKDSLIQKDKIINEQKQQINTLIEGINDRSNDNRLTMNNDVLSNKLYQETTKQQSNDITGIKDMLASMFALMKNMETKVTNIGKKQEIHSLNLKNVNDSVEEILDNQKNIDININDFKNNQFEFNENIEVKINEICDNITKLPQQQVMLKQIPSSESIETNMTAADDEFNDSNFNKINEHNKTLSLQSTNPATSNMSEFRQEIKKAKQNENNSDETEETAQQISAFLKHERQQSIHLKKINEEVLTNIATQLNTPMVTVDDGSPVKRNGQETPSLDQSNNNANNNDIWNNVDDDPWANIDETKDNNDDPWNNIDDPFNETKSNNKSNNNGVKKDGFDPLNLFYIDSPKAKKNAKVPTPKQSIIVKKSKHNKTTSKTNTGTYSVGAKIDVLDPSFFWYSAEIIDIDFFERRGIKISYDGFSTKWNEWVSIDDKYRICKHKERSLGYGKTQGGVFSILTTQFYKKDEDAKDLRQYFESDSNKNINKLTLLMSLETKTILINGYLKQKGTKTWKRRWFVLRNNGYLYKYDHEYVDPNNYRGMIGLSNILTLKSSKHDDESYVFDLQTNRAVYTFSCENSIILTDWMSVIDTIMKNMTVIQPKPTKLNILTNQHTFGGTQRRSMRTQFSMVFKQNGF